MKGYDASGVTKLDVTFSTAQISAPFNTAGKRIAGVYFPAGSVEGEYTVCMSPTGSSSDATPVLDETGSAKVFIMALDATAGTAFVELPPSLGYSCNTLLLQAPSAYTSDVTVQVYTREV